MNWLMVATINDVQKHTLAINKANDTIVLMARVRPTLLKILFTILLYMKLTSGQ